MTEPLYIAQYIRTDNDENGNPRRGWIVCHVATSETVDFVDEGYDGFGALFDRYPKTRTFCTPPVRVPVSEYESWKRFTPEVGDV